ncbi:hypothetical protein [Methanococcoides sp.]|uniref:hypothetical protein n=1 Tax=Methanococcoides sp. TaxID=1966350 RepID=UPI00272E640E|nr:hypothetical protein [Methanococcoides sp.]
MNAEDPLNEMLLFEKGNALSRLKRDDEAIECHDRIPEISPYADEVRLMKDKLLKGTGNSILKWKESTFPCQT